MGATKRVRWDCPNGQHPGVLGPAQPRHDSIVRYCLPCSEASGRLTPRVAPTLERRRQGAAERSKVKAKRTRAAAARARTAAQARADARYTVEGVDLRDVVATYRRLPVFRGGRLTRVAPSFTVRHHRHSPSRVGFAEPWHWRIHLALWDDMSLMHARETILHELVHLHVGRNRFREWHGIEFRTTLRRAAEQAGIRAC